MLVSMHELLKPTREHGFAIGAFNVADSCFIRAVVEEAEATNTPAIISIHPSEHDFVGDAFFSYVRDITQRSRVPFTLHLDHGASVEHVLRAIQCGFTSVMIDGSLLPYEENVALTREVVRLAHAVGVSVEGELGTIGQTGTSVEGGVSEVTYTDPAQAEDFVARTGVDTLAVAIGTAHGIYPKGCSRSCRCTFCAISPGVCRFRWCCTAARLIRMRKLRNPLRLASAKSIFPAI
jgi:fructose-bisphosphate aldolase class II